MDGTRGTETELSRRLRAAWKRSGLTQKEIAKRMGLRNYQQVGAWINGEKEPRTTNLAKFAEAVGAPLEEFFIETVDRMVEGEDPAAVLASAAGAPFTLEEALAISQEGRLFLQTLVRHLPRPWDELTDQEKGQIFDQLVEAAFRRTDGR